MVLLLAIPLSAQLSPNPEFQETAVIPAFHRRNPNIIHFQTFYRKDLDGRHTLLLIRGGAPRAGWPLLLKELKDFWWNRDDLLGLFLTKTSNPDRVWELVILANEYDDRVEVDRTDDGSIVLSRTRGDYGVGADTIKIFFDVTSKRMLKRIEFAPLPVRQILALNDNLYFVVGSEEQTLMARLDEDTPIWAIGTEMDPALADAWEAPTADVTPFMSSLPGLLREYLPIGLQGRFAAALVFHPHTGAVEGVEGVAERVGHEYKLYELPKSTPEGFATARPEWVQRHRRRPDVASFEHEVIGPYQIVGDRFWFGKTFYDGEGSTGVGGFGYFDPEDKKYVVFSPSEIAPWSASALWVEDAVVWVGRVRHPEGAPFPGGILRYERASGEVKEFDVGEVISQIKRWQGKIYLATDNGLYILQDSRLTRYVFEPALNGGTAIFKSQP